MFNSGGQHSEQQGQYRGSLRPCVMKHSTDEQGTKAEEAWANGVGLCKSRGDIEGH